MMPPSKIPRANAFRDAFLALEPQMTATQRRLLEVHYAAPDRQLTMIQIAEAMGWKSYVSGNCHYGRLAKLVAGHVGFRHDGCYLFTLCEFLPPQEKGDHWLITMRREVADALTMLGWFVAPQTA